MSPWCSGGRVVYGGTHAQVFQAFDLFGYQRVTYGLRVTRVRGELARWKYRVHDKGSIRSTLEIKQDALATSVRLPQNSDPLLLTGTLPRLRYPRSNVKAALTCMALPPRFQTSGCAVPLSQEAMNRMMRPVFLRAHTR